MHIRERLPVLTEVDVEALALPHSCPECERSFSTSRGLTVHRARWCRPGQRPASRRGQLADKAVKLVKRKVSAALLPPVIMEGESLESVYQFDYLGCRSTSDGDDAADMRHRMAIAGERSRSLNYLWSDNRLPRSLKLRIYAASVCSNLTHGSEAWMLMLGAICGSGDSLVFIFPLAPMLTFTSAVGKLNVRVLWHHRMLLQVISQRYCQVFVKSYNFVFEKIDKEGSPREK